MKIQLRPWIYAMLTGALLMAASAFAADAAPIANVANQDEAPVVKDVSLSSTALMPGMTVDQIVSRLDEENAQRAAALHGFKGKRVYRLSYHGFPGSRKAELDVVAHYEAPDTKSFDVVSESGSKVLRSRVLEKLLETEKEAANPKNQRETALTPENYKFKLMGTRPSRYGGCYVLKVEPRRKNKFLYRGEICVNAADFAVESIDAEPAKNPSFWIKSTQIEHRYEKIGEFWVPVSNKSVSHLRFLNGEATLHINYTRYDLH